MMFPLVMYCCAALALPLGFGVWVLFSKFQSSLERSDAKRKRENEIYTGFEDYE